MSTYDELADRQRQKTYLGDGAYVALNEGGGCVLTTETGYRTTNIVVLEPETLVALLDVDHTGTQRRKT